MELPLPVMSGDADSTWSDSHAMDSDDSRLAADMIVRSTAWIRADSSSSSRSTLVSEISAASHLSAGQLSPISIGVDIPGAVSDVDRYPLTASTSLSSAPTLDNTTSLSSPTLENSTSPSSNSEPRDICADGHDHSHAHGGHHGNHGHDHSHYEDAANDHMDTAGDMQWDVDMTDDVIIPKLEPMEDDTFRFDDLDETPANPEPTDTTAPNASTKVKRPRGRPRKLSIVPTAPTNPGKIAKGRSKTGCVTCRKRKKKCDEAKPRCKSGRDILEPIIHNFGREILTCAVGMNCEKNAVVCEGYPEKQIWKSGKEKAEEGKSYERFYQPSCLPSVAYHPKSRAPEESEPSSYHHAAHLHGP